MKIEKWAGLVSAASPYALPAGATTEQNNLQIRKPGQLVPRPGLQSVYETSVGASLAIHRQSPGGSSNDRLVEFSSTTDESGGFQYVLRLLTVSGNALTATAIYSFSSTELLRPAMCQDRHGDVFVFFGNGIRPKVFRYDVNPNTVSDFGIDAPTIAPQVSPSGDGWFIERVDVLSSGTSYYTPPTLTVESGDPAVPSTQPARDAKLRAVVQGGAVVAVDVVDGGSNFKDVPTIKVSDEQVGTGFLARGIQTTVSAIYGFLDTASPVTGFNPSGSFTAATVTAVTITAGGTGYTTAPSVTFSAPPSGVTATGTATIASGRVTGVTITNAGSGYVAAPTITFGGPGTGAAATAVITPWTHSSDLSTNLPKIAYRTGNGPTFGTGVVDATFNAITGKYTAIIPLDHSVSTTATGSSAATTITVGSASGITTGMRVFGTGIATAATVSTIAGTTITLSAANTAAVSGIVTFAPVTQGTDAFAEVQFDVVSAAYKLGEANPSGSYTGGQLFSTSSGTKVNFASIRTAWYTTDDYFENTSSPPRWGLGGDVYYSSNANRDKFWALMHNPGVYRFAKRQVVFRSKATGSFGSVSYPANYANYHFPDYSRVGYRLLTGDQSRPDIESNWTVGSSPVLTDGGKPYIDIDLQPAKKSGGAAYAQQAGTTFPKIRVFLKYCPDSWTVDSSGNALPSAAGEDHNRRYTPQTGQDRRANFADTSTNVTSNNESGTILEYAIQSGSNNANLNAMDTHKRWWGVGHANNRNSPQSQPITDIRTSEGGNHTHPTTDTGVGNGSVVVITPGSLMERGTRFVLRFEQYNAADYQTETESKDFSWITSANESKFPTLRTKSVSSMDRKGDFGVTYTDLVFEANVVDTTQGAQSLLLPGPVSGVPKVVIGGTGWTASGQQAQFTLRQRTSAFQDPVVFSDSVSYRFATTELVAASKASRIGSVTITSQGQGYYREPTLLFRGGGGYGLKTQAVVSGGRVTNVIIIDGGDGFTSDTILYTDVQPVKLLPILRGTMRGIYRCAYRFADYSKTVVLSTTISTTAGSTAAILANAAGVKPGMQITGAIQNNGVAALPHLVRIISVSGTSVTLSKPATATAAGLAVVVRDMTLPIAYSDFSPILDVDASANGSGRAAILTWTLPGVTAPTRADYVEFWRTSADQSLVFYRLDQYGTVNGGLITIRGTDGLSDEELFDFDRPAYAALPVVLPNGGLNAYRFGTGRSDMAVCVAWQDRLWYGVSTSGKDENTVFFSELDEFESCPDVNELPIQANLRSTDYLTALVPFGSVLMAMQNAHSYSINYNTDPTVDATVNLVSHRGCLNQRCWDIFEDLLFAADERGVYAMSRSGDVAPLSEAVRDYFDENKLDLAYRRNFHLRVDQKTGILRLFVSLAGFSSEYPHMALCYHIANKAWWTESWPNSLTCSGDYRPPNRSDIVVYGAVDGCIYEMAGMRDVTFRDLISVTITNGGSGYVTPPTITAPGGRGAVLKAILTNGVVTEVLILRGGYRYGDFDANSNFLPTVTLTFSAPPSGVTATGTATARAPSSGTVNDLPVRLKATVPWSMRTGPMELAYEGNARKGEAQMDRSIIVTYKPTDTTTVLNLREYYNNSDSPRPNVMRRDRGTGFVHETTGAKTTLDMKADRSKLGLSTGLAKAMFAGRSLDDVGSADRHIAIELSRDSVSADSGTTSEPLIYSLEVRGTVDGSN